ncbi:MAG: hypothetical protein Q7U02_15685 [Desulfosalsimonadaceae bacterium]|nr:hypothetical protein [Desulfosalsimonadaceae bacterium]
MMEGLSQKFTHASIRENLIFGGFFPVFLAGIQEEAEPKPL